MELGLATIITKSPTVILGWRQFLNGSRCEFATDDRKTELLYENPVAVVDVTHHSRTVKGIPPNVLFDHNHGNEIRENTPAYQPVKQVPNTLLLR